MKYILTICSLLLLSAAPFCLAYGIDIQQRNFVVPLVKGDGYTALIRLKLSLPREERLPVLLQQVILSLDGTTDLSDIDAIQIYGSTDSNYLRKEKASQAALFARYDGAGLKAAAVAINGNLRILSGDYYIWIGLSLKQSANIHNRIVLAPLSVQLSGRERVVLAGDPVFFRMATAVRRSMQDNIHTSRIPGIATAKNGDLLAVFDARYRSWRDLQGDIDIALCRSADKGNSWLPVQQIIDKKTWGGLPEKFNGVSDGCVLVDENSGNIFVAGLWMYGVLDENGRWIEGLTDSSEAWNHQWLNRASQPGFDPKQTAQFLIVKSIDNGQTWSEPVNITRMGKKEAWWLWAPAPGQGLTLDDGTLVFPSQGRDNTGKPFSNITYSKDGGKTWTSSQPALAEATTESAVVQLDDGSLMLNMRTNANAGLTGAGNGRSVAVTTDMGKTWKEHPSSRKALPEPVCMASLHKHEFVKDGRKRSVLLFTNPNTTTARNHITLKVSFDNGSTWPSQQYILLDELNGAGYSCITSIDANTIGVLYESSQAQLVFQQIGIDELVKQ